MTDFKGVASWKEDEKEEWLGGYKAGRSDYAGYKEYRDLSFYQKAFCNGYEEGWCDAEDEYCEPDYEDFSL